MHKAQRSLYCPLIVSFNFRNRLPVFPCIQLDFCFDAKRYNFLIRPKDLPPNSVIAVKAARLLSPTFYRPLVPLLDTFFTHGRCAPVTVPRLSDTSTSNLSFYNSSRVGILL
jgi:hypothetical protein